MTLFSTFVTFCLRLFPNINFRSRISLATSVLYGIFNLVSAVFPNRFFFSNLYVEILRLNKTEHTIKIYWWEEWWILRAVYIMYMWCSSHLCWTIVAQHSATIFLVDVFGKNIIVCKWLWNIKKNSNRRQHCTVTQYVLMYTI